MALYDSNTPVPPAAVPSLRQLSPKSEPGAGHGMWIASVDAMLQWNRARDQ